MRRVEPSAPPPGYQDFHSKTLLFVNDIELFVCDIDALFLCIVYKQNFVKMPRLCAFGCAPSGKLFLVSKSKTTSYLQVNQINCQSEICL